MNEIALADLESHHIEGFAREGGGVPFKVPLFSYIADNLYTGGCPRGEALPSFRFIVDVYARELYHCKLHQAVLCVPLLDSSDGPDADLVLVLARHVNECRKIGPTLVHCQAGLNRSALVAGLALIEGGMPAEHAIWLMRERRSPAVLCNRVFEQFLLDWKRTA